MKSPVIINQRRLFLASFVAMIALAMFFAIRSDILSSLGREFDLSHQQQGLINTAVGLGFPVAVLVAGTLCDVIGMGRLMGLACLGHIAGIVLTIVSPTFGFPVLLLAAVVIGLSDGVVEAVINPLVVTMYPRNKTGVINVLHAAWPVGLIIGGLLCVAISWMFGLAAPNVAAASVSLSWKVKMATVLVPAVLYGALIFGQKLPQTERAASGVPMSAMFKETLRPGYLVLLACMAFTAVVEMGPDQWIGSVMTATVGIRGIVFLVYSSVFMLVLRLYAGVLVRVFTPFGLLAGSCFLAGLGLYWMSYSFTSLMAFTAVTVFAIGKTCLWPTLVGVTAERYPRGGSLLMAMLVAVAMVAGGLASPMIGRIYDRHTIQHLPEEVAKVVVVDGRFSPAAVETLHVPEHWAAVRAAEKHGAAMTFRYLAAVPIVPFVIFVAFGLYHRARGGYRAVSISAPKEKE